MTAEDRLWWLKRIKKQKEKEEDELRKAKKKS